MFGLEKIITTPTPLVQLHSPLFSEKHVSVYVKCDYQTHPEISGNKWRKLKYNLLEMKRLEINQLVTFGGAYSNHLYAVSAVARYSSVNVTAFIRGDELNENSNKTLRFARDSGVKLRFVSRTAYRNKAALLTGFGPDWFILPEGGTNAFSGEGVAEMTDEILKDIQPDFILAAMGTGGTVAGILSNQNTNATVVGIPVLKGGNDLMADLTSHISPKNRERLRIYPDYHFGGYGKFPAELQGFKTDWENAFNIPLDAVYTAKLFYGAMDLIKKGTFPLDSILVIYHSGGLRG